MSVPVAYVLMIVVWATTPLTIKFSTDSVDAVFAALSRVVVGAALGVVLAIMLKVRVPWGRDALRTYLIGNINIFIGVYLTFKGAQQLPSGMVSVLFGLSPVMSALFARLFLQEKPLTLIQWGAALLGLTGLLLVFREQVQISAAHLLAVLYVLGAVLCFCFSSVMLKRWPTDMSALAQTTGSLLLGILFYLVLNFFVGDYGLTRDSVLTDGLIAAFTKDLSLSTRSLYAILYLGVFGSLLGIMCYFYALTHLSASTVALSTLVTPMIALTLGRTLNNEVLTQGELVGAGCIIVALGVYYWGGNLNWRLGSKTGVKHGLL